MKQEEKLLPLCANAVWEEMDKKKNQELIDCIAPIYDPVNKPKHYNVHPSGVECIQVTEHMSFCIGNAIKYLWRCDHKNGLEDLKKAQWYINREIERRTKEPL